MNPAELVLLGLALFGSVWAAGRFFSLTRNERERARETARRRAQGVRNAEAEARAREELCAVCGESVDPAEDLYDGATAAWWHKRCWRESLK